MGVGVGVRVMMVGVVVGVSVRCGWGREDEWCGGVVA